MPYTQHDMPKGKTSDTKALHEMLIKFTPVFFYLPKTWSCGFYRHHILWKKCCWKDRFSHKTSTYLSVVNFINILPAHFAPIFWCQKNLNPKQSFVIFGAKILYKKSAHKMLMKLTPGKQFISTLICFLFYENH